MQANTDNWQQIKADSEAVLPKAIINYIRKCRQTPHPESHLISVLHKVQDAFGYLGDVQMNAVAQLLQVPTAKVSGVATFYHYFRLRPKGRFVINVCMGTACFVRGAEKVAARLCSELAIDFGETTADGLFSLEQTRCLGTCGLAPVVMINDESFAKVNAIQIPELLAKFRRQAESAGELDS